jgi:hypothetical protein
MHGLVNRTPDKTVFTSNGTALKKSLLETWVHNNCWAASGTLWDSGRTCRGRPPHPRAQRAARPPQSSPGRIGPAGPRRKRPPTSSSSSRRAHGDQAGERHPEELRGSGGDRGGSHSLHEAVLTSKLPVLGRDRQIQIFRPHTHTGGAGGMEKV